MLRFKKESSRKGSVHAESGERMKTGTDPAPGASKDQMFLQGPGFFTPFDPVLTPVDIDKIKRDMAFVMNDESARAHVMQEMADLGIADSSSLMNLLAQEQVPEEQKLFFRDFVLWLCGRPVDPDDKSRTPWLKDVPSDWYEKGKQQAWDRTKLVVPGEDVKKFLTSIIAARERFSKQLEDLQITFKGGLMEAYIYFKYIIRGNRPAGTTSADPIVNQWLGDLKVMTGENPGSYYYPRGPGANIKQERRPKIEGQPNMQPQPQVVAATGNLPSAEELERLYELWHGEIEGNAKKILDLTGRANKIFETQERTNELLGRLLDKPVPQSVVVQQVAPSGPGELVTYEPRITTRFIDVEKPVYRVQEVPFTVERPSYKIQEVPYTVERPSYKIQDVPQTIEKPTFVTKEKEISVPVPGGEQITATALPPEIAEFLKDWKTIKRVDFDRIGKALDSLNIHTGEAAAKNIKRVAELEEEIKAIEDAENVAALKNLPVPGNEPESSHPPTTEAPSNSQELTRLQAELAEAKKHLSEEASQQTVIAKKQFEAIMAERKAQEESENAKRAHEIAELKAAFETIVKERTTVYETAHAKNQLELDQAIKKAKLVAEDKLKLEQEGKRTISTLEAKLKEALDAQKNAEMDKEKTTLAVQGQYNLAVQTAERKIAETKYEYEAKLHNVSEMFDAASKTVEDLRISRDNAQKALSSITETTSKQIEQITSLKDSLAAANREKEKLYSDFVEKTMTLNNQRMHQESQISKLRTQQEKLKAKIDTLKTQPEQLKATKKSLKRLTADLEKLQGKQEETTRSLEEVQIQARNRITEADARASRLEAEQRRWLPITRRRDRASVEELAEEIIEEGNQRKRAKTTTRAYPEAAGVDLAAARLEFEKLLQGMPKFGAKMPKSTEELERDLKAAEDSQEDATKQIAVEEGAAMSIKDKLRLKAQQGIAIRKQLHMAIAEASDFYQQPEALDAVIQSEKNMDALMKATTGIETLSYGTISDVLQPGMLTGAYTRLTGQTLPAEKETAINSALNSLQNNPTLYKQRIAQMHENAPLTRIMIREFFRKYGKVELNDKQIEGLLMQVNSRLVPETLEGLNELWLNQVPSPPSGPSLLDQIEPSVTTLTEEKEEEGSATAPPLDEEK